jgi:hypothetical protein
MECFFHSVLATGWLASLSLGFRAWTWSGGGGEGGRDGAGAGGGKESPTMGLVYFKKILQNFSDFPSHRIFRRMYKVLNIDKNKN